MKTHSFILKTTVLILILILTSLSSCDKSEESFEAKDAPQLPPQASMIIDFSDFDNNNQKSGKDIKTMKNWGYAAINVAVWNTIITVGLVVPVLSFAEAFNHEAVQQSANQWAWSYSFKVTGIVHTAKLLATLNTTTIKWEMYISKDGHYNDFLWYEGQSMLDRSGGNWIMNESPEKPNHLLDITWQWDEQVESGNIKYTNIRENDVENGGFIQYGLNPENEFSAFYSIFNKGKLQETNIEWNRETKDGRVKDMVHFGDENWHCWNSALKDIDCE